MANIYITPVGVTLDTSETTIYTTPASTEAMVIVRFANVDTVTRNLNAWVYSSGSASDAKRIVPLDFQIVSGQQLELGPLYLSAGYKITATASSANKINAVPMGIETT